MKSTITSMFNADKASSYLETFAMLPEPTAVDDAAPDTPGVASAGAAVNEQEQCDASDSVTSPMPLADAVDGPLQDCSLEPTAVRDEALDTAAVASMGVADSE